MLPFHWIQILFAVFLCGVGLNIEQYVSIFQQIKYSNMHNALMASQINGEMF